MIDNKIYDLVNECEKDVKDQFDKIDILCEKNSLKILNAFRNNNVSEIHFNSSTGYGYNDIGRDVIEKFLLRFWMQKMLLSEVNLFLGLML